MAARRTISWSWSADMHATNDLWRQAGCEGWSYRDILPYFKRAESRAAGADTYHGGDGPMQLNRSRYSNLLQEVFIEAGQQAGFPYTGDFNGYQQEGVGWFDLNIHHGNRWDTGRAYIWPVLSRDNLTLDLNAFSDPDCCSKAPARLGSSMSVMVGLKNATPAVR